MRISDWSSDVCSSDLLNGPVRARGSDLRAGRGVREGDGETLVALERRLAGNLQRQRLAGLAGGEAEGAAGEAAADEVRAVRGTGHRVVDGAGGGRSEERRVGKECVSTGRSRGSRYH